MPMIAIALGQVIMSFNVASLPVASVAMVESFHGAANHSRDRHRACIRCWWPGLVMLGAKLAQRFGALRVFRAAVLAVRRVPGADDVQPERNSNDRCTGA